jgi:D-hydroxyproline dehydrogenase subunit beta
VSTLAIFDDCILGAGVVGLAHAYHLARRGRRVLVVESSTPSQLEVVQLCGAFLSSEQGSSATYAVAMKSRRHWLELLRQAQAWHATTGILYLAKTEEEMQLLREFLALPDITTRNYELLDTVTARQRATWLKEEKIIGALWCPEEFVFDMRQAMQLIPQWLHEKFGVQLRYETTGQSLKGHFLETDRGTFHSKNFWICSGNAASLLFPEIMQESGLFRCREQWMRTQPQPADSATGAIVASALNLLSQPTGMACPEAATLREQLEREANAYLQQGISFLAVPESQGTVCLGTSHEYGDEIYSPYLNGEIEESIQEQVNTFLELPNPRIKQRWYSTYTKHSYEPWYVARPAENVTIVNGLGAAEITLAFGLADNLVKEKLFENDRIELVIFDLDGTLVNDTGGVAQCLRDALLDFGMQTQLAAITQVMAWPKLMAIRHLVENATQHAERLRDQINMIYANFANRLKRFYMHDPRVQSVPGALDVFRQLHERGIKVAINTTFTREITQTLLHRLNWKQGEHFDTVISSDEVARGRPFPDMIQTTMKRLNISKPTHVAKVGDTPADVEEGLAAGCGLVATILCGNYKSEDFYEPRPHAMIQSLAEFLLLLPEPEAEDF